MGVNSLFLFAYKNCKLVQIGETKTTAGKKIKPSLITSRQQLTMCFKFPANLASVAAYL